MSSMVHAAPSYLVEFLLVQVDTRPHRRGDKLSAGTTVDGRKRRLICRDMAIAVIQGRAGSSASLAMQEQSCPRSFDTTAEAKQGRNRRYRTTATTLRDDKRHGRTRARAPHVWLALKLHVFAYVHMPRSPALDDPNPSCTANSFIAPRCS